MMRFGCSGGLSLVGYVPTQRWKVERGVLVTNAEVWGYAITNGSVPAWFVK